MTVRKGEIHLALVLSAVLAGGLLAQPVGAQSTEEQLEDARARLTQLEGEANQATQRYDEANETLIRTQDEIAATQAALDNARRRIASLQSSLDQRAHEAYQLGTVSSFEMLLESEDFSEFSDRLEYLDRLAQDDADLATRVAVLSEELRRHETNLSRLEEVQAAALEKAEREKAIVYDKLAEAEALREELADQLAAEQAAALAAQQAAAAAAAAAGSTGGATSGGTGSIGTVSGEALQACPAPGTAFGDTFGAPRSGGRAHAGVDMMGGYGQPVYAALPGTVSHSSSSLGGNQAYVHSAGGTYTFYAHLQGFSDASGSVSAGTLIGYIGDTGNATGTPHLHFEYHPNGSLVNPTPYVAAVC
ncbi:MAG: murein hydrolase activator EnvC family protein [Actinomycetota bacterium]